MRLALGLTHTLITSKRSCDGSGPSDASAVHAESCPARDYVLVNERLAVVDRHPKAKALDGDGQDAYGHGQVPLHAGEYVLPQGGAGVGEADVRERVGGDGHAAASVISHDEVDIPGAGMVSENCEDRTACGLRWYSRFYAMFSRF